MVTLGHSFAPYREFVAKTEQKVSESEIYIRLTDEKYVLSTCRHSLAEAIK